MSEPAVEPPDEEPEIFTEISISTNALKLPQRTQPVLFFSI